MKNEGNYMYVRANDNATMIHLCAAFEIKTLNIKHILIAIN